ncbi:MAG: hypothetical protein NUV50_06895 [Rhodospirillales bacterium]|nr:hypothetical protein [Rhodospirillales bacterium]
MLYEYDKRSVTGHSEIDRLHVEIADQSRRLAALLKQPAGFDEIYDSFMQLQDVLRVHFNVEEHDMMLLEQNDEVRDHFRRHKENHKLFRDLLTYGEEQFEKNRAMGKVPNVLGLIPQEYFEELKNIDQEMSALFAKYDPQKSASA